MTNTKIRFQDTENGPSTSGSSGNGVLIDSATPAQTSCSLFCMTIQAPIMTSIVVSMSAPRRRLSSSNSIAAPIDMPIAIANASASKEIDAETS